MKATWCQINGEPHEIFKQPKTDSGMKNSLKGLIQVVRDQDNKLVARDQCNPLDEGKSLLQTVFENGKLVKEFTLAEIRRNVDRSLV